jgi:hypothetical protein
LGENSPNLVTLATAVPKLREAPLESNENKLKVAESRSHQKMVVGSLPWKS